MSMNRQIITDDDLIAFIAEGMEEYIPDGLEAESAADTDDEEDYVEEYVTEDDIARENGFWVDEDGHWQELDDDLFDW